MTGSRTGRRSPAPRERQRDAERSKRLLMEAAVVEFSAHGFSGARVGDIAARAGVNKQLISYYFGGKQGLYDALSDQWRRDEQRLAGPGQTLAEVAGAYARATLQAPDLARMLIREGLDGAPGSAESGDAQRRRFGAAAADLRRRQREGELPADLDPACAGLALFAISAAPISFPHVAQAFGLDVTEAGFADRYAEEVARLVTCLMTPRSASTRAPALPSPAAP